MAEGAQATANITTSWSPVVRSAWRIEPTDVSDSLALDLAAVEQWMRTSGPPVAGPLVATRISGGHSNITYRLDLHGAPAYVLRRPPYGDLPPGAHDVLREARLLQALRDRPARTPVVVATCADAELIGAPFYVMERVEGDVLTSAIPPAIDDEASLAHDAERGRRFGFAGKLCIHPKQLAVTNRAFSPSGEEVAWAEALLAAEAGRPAAERGAFSFRGAMIDRPVLERARQILALAHKSGGAAG
jgi:hypothetical protein